MLQLSVWGVSTMLQTSNSMFGGIYSLVRLIFAAEERLFTLVLFPPLQVCYTLFSTLNIVLFPPLQSPWVPVTQGSLLSRIITGYGPWPATPLNTALACIVFNALIKFQLNCFTPSHKITHSSSHTFLPHSIFTILHYGLI